MQSSRNNGNGGIQFVNETESIIRESLGPELYDLQNVKRTGSDAGFDSDSETEVVRVPAGPQNGPKPGKKTKGRVKIRMEFIENKLRRYTTFSKRKTGIMKKAYELSTLTGTQVMLLVASETGHVYTFATRKLQPMITSESGKALIQTCLNSPDNPPLSSGSGNDQRMNPTGFEETELSYAITEDESQKSPDSNQRLQYVGSSLSRESSATPPENYVQSSMSLQPVASPSNQGLSAAPRSKQPIAMTTYINPQLAPSSPASKTSVPANNISMQLPTGGIATLLPPASLSGLSGLSGLPHGTPIAVNALPTGQPTVSGQQQAAAPHAIYRIPAGHGGQVGQLVSIPGLAGQGTASHQPSKPEATQSSPAGAATTHQQPMAVVTGAGTVVYQTPQGMMYAAPSSLGGIPEGYVLNLPQAPTLVQQNSEQGGATQQYITIPVPVSLATGQQMFQPMITQAAATGDSHTDEKRK